MVTPEVTLTISDLKTKTPGELSFLSSFFLVALCWEQSL